jgi:hypothetical protein
MDYARSHNLNAQRGNALHIEAHDLPPRERADAFDESGDSMRWIAAVVFVMIALGTAIFLYG